MSGLLLPLPEFADEVCLTRWLHTDAISHDIAVTPNARAETQGRGIQDPRTIGSKSGRPCPRLNESTSPPLRTKSYMSA